MGSGKTARTMRRASRLHPEGRPEEPLRGSPEGERACSDTPAWTKERSWPLQQRHCAGRVGSGRGCPRGCGQSRGPGELAVELGPGRPLVTQRLVTYLHPAPPRDHNGRRDGGKWAERRARGRAVPRPRRDSAVLVTTDAQTNPVACVPLTPSPRIVEFLRRRTPAMERSSSAIMSVQTSVPVQPRML